MDTIVFLWEGLAHRQCSIMYTRVRLQNIKNLDI
jgi:hypothetical protein